MERRMDEDGVKNLAYRLPRRHAGAADLLAELRSAGRESVAVKGRVLVMDDEEVIRTVLCMMLMAFGYDVKLTEDGDEAVIAYTEALKSGYPFDAVILDLNVPGSSGGREAMGRLLAIDPGVRAIVTSGNYDDPRMRDFRDYGFKAALRKPYDLDELRRLVNSIIDKREEANALPRLKFC